ncbi:MAG: choice-of-anchor tandem repeat NxxGxxAF-containing protein [Planctomycetota bacterium]
MLRALLVSIAITAAWSADAQVDLRPVVREGDPVPALGDGVVVDRFGGLNGFGGFSPSLGNDGTVAFAVLLAGPGVNFANNEAILRGRKGEPLEVIARTGDQAPGFPPGVTLDVTGPPTIGKDGRIRFDTFVNTPTGSDRVEYITDASGRALPYLVPPADVSHIVQGGELTSTNIWTTNVRGALISSGFIRTTNPDDPTIGVVFIDDPTDGFSLVYRSDEPLPGLPANVSPQFISQGNSVLTESGHTAFRVELSGSTVGSANRNAIYRRLNGGPLEYIARSQDPIPGENPGVTFSFSSMDNPLLQESGELIFYSIRSGTSMPGQLARTLFSVSPSGEYGILATAGIAPPGTPDGEVIDQLRPLRTEPTQDGTIGVAGRFEDVGDDFYALLAQDGTMRVVAFDGPALPQITPESKLIGFRAVGLNDRGQFVFSAFVDPLPNLPRSGEAVLATDATGSVHPLALIGMTVDADPDPSVTDPRELRQIFDRFELNDAGDVLLWVDFTFTGQQALFLAKVPDDSCPADTNGDGQLSPNDFNAWILAFNNQSPECDQNGDGDCRQNDFNAWILNFNAGC